MVGPTITSTANPRLVWGVADALILRKSDMKKMLTAVDKLFRANQRKLFATEGSSGGPKWKALKQSTIDRKKRQRAGIKKVKARGFKVPLNSTSMKIMQRTGNLRKGTMAKGHRDHVAEYRISPNNSSIRVGTRNIVAAYHGADWALRGRNPKLPIRNVLQMKMKQRRKYIRAVTDYQVLQMELAHKRFRRATTKARAEVRQRAASSAFSSLLDGRSTSLGS